MAYFDNIAMYGCKLGFAVGYVTAPHLIISSQMSAGRRVLFVYRTRMPLLSAWDLRPQFVMR
jgi:hypothetical protein